MKNYNSNLYGSIILDRISPIDIKIKELDFLNKRNTGFAM